MQRFLFLALALLLLPSAPSAQTFQIDARESTQLAFDVSPDGSTLVIDLLGQLWTLPVSGGEARALTNALRDQSEDIDPAFSPDGRWIAFQSDRPGGRGVWLIPATGGIPRLVTRIADDRAWPAWAPDGRRIALAISQNQLAIVEVGSGRIDTLVVTGPPSSAVREPLWTADGRHILFVNAPRYNSVGGTVWRVADTGGLAARIGTERLRVLGLARSADERLAFFVRDSATLKYQLVFADSAATLLRHLASHEDLTPLDARFTRDGRSVIYHADGQLWIVDTGTDSRRRIPLRARLNVSSTRRELPPLGFPAPATPQSARGFRALELSPDGRRIAMVALDSLWLFAPGDRPRALMAVPRDVDEVAWSPDGSRLAWVAGAEREVYVVDLSSATSRRVTTLPGHEGRPAWSPDGRYLAFFHGPEGWRERRLRVIRSDVPQPVENADSTLPLAANDAFGRYHQADNMGQEVLNWSADSRGVYVLDAPTQKLVRARLDGGADTLPESLLNATFLRILGDTVAVFVRDDQLWRARFDPAVGVHDSAQLIADVALYPSLAGDGAVLYVAGDGLRIRGGDGAVRSLGWPLTYRSPRVPPLLLRSVRVINPGTGQVTAPRDLLLRDGRIAQVADAGKLRAETGVSVIDAAGRFAIPGLIDLHQHFWDDAQPPGLVAYGVTTARDLGSPLARTAAMRDAIDAGLRAGPRIVLGGMQVHGTRKAEFGWSGQLTQALVDTGAAARALELLRAFGAEHLKLYQFERWFDAARIAQLAHAHGMRVTGHVSHPLALASEMDGKEHVGRAGGYHRLDAFVYDDVVQLFRGAATAVVPTLSMFATAMRLYDDSTLLAQPEIQPFLSPYLRFFASYFPSPPSPAARRGWTRLNEIMRSATRTLATGGVLIGAGTDVPQVPWAMHLEMEELVASGLTPVQALRAATRDAAKILGAPDLGCIAFGCVADVVVLDANPLDDIRNTRRIWVVIANGRVRLRAAAQTRR
ncbi:MAG: amidohydrolase family protein [Gemmatimonadales bacterium]|nr:amidohydrolase family protein [Gemmatimonadales bacterium]